MTDEEIVAKLDVGCRLGPFEARNRNQDLLFLAPHRSRPRLLLTWEAREDLPNAIPAAVEEAVELLAAEGGDVVIRHYSKQDPRAGLELEVVRASIR